LTTSVFTTGEIYATAFASATANGFHYTLSVMQNSTTCIKYHARGPSSKHFIFESIPQFKLLNASESLCVAVKIGSFLDNFFVFCEEMADYSLPRRNRSKPRGTSKAIRGDPDDSPDPRL
jgi:hypothetical protein